MTVFLLIAILLVLVLQSIFLIHLSIRKEQERPQPEQPEPASAPISPVKKILDPIFTSEERLWQIERETLKQDGFELD